VATPAGFEPATFSLEVSCCTISRPLYPQRKSPEIAISLTTTRRPCTAVKCRESFTAVTGVTLPRRHPGGGHADKEAHRSIRRAGAAPPPMAASSTSMPHSPAWRCASPPPAARVGARSIASTADCAGSRSAPTQPSSLHKRGARQLQRSSAYGKASSRQKKSARAAIVARLRLTRLLPSLTTTLNAI
jgi:hypothetical protein